MSAPMPRVTTQYPAAEPAVYTAPLYQPVGVEQLIANSATVAALQAQIADLISRVTALEGGE